MLRLRLYYEIVWDSYDLTSFHLTHFTLALDQIVKSKSALNIFLISHKKKNFNKLKYYNNFITFINFNKNFIRKFPILKSRFYSRYIISKTFRTKRFNTSELHANYHHPKSSIHQKRSIKKTGQCLVSSVHRSHTRLVYYSLILYNLAINNARS